MKCTRDQLYSVNARTAVQAAYGALSANQSETPAVQVMAPAIAFLTISQELGLDINQLLASASQIIKHDDNPYRTEVAAFRAYVAGELK